MGGYEASKFVKIGIDALARGRKIEGLYFIAILAAFLLPTLYIQMQGILSVSLFWRRVLLWMPIILTLPAFLCPFVVQAQQRYGQEVNVTVGNISEWGRILLPVLYCQIRYVHYATIVEYNMYINVNIV
jgi:hypothetical protein